MNVDCFDSNDDCEIQKRVSYSCTFRFTRGKRPVCSQYGANVRLQWSNDTLKRMRAHTAKYRNRQDERSFSSKYRQAQYDEPVDYADGDDTYDETNSQVVYID